MSLLRRKILILDCQTTGTSAARDHLLELGWALLEGEDEPEPASLLLKVPTELPRKVTEITGIRAADLERATEPATALDIFRGAIGHEPLLALAHYAQFERPFLEKFFADHGAEPRFELLCSYKIAQRLFPEAPSRNIRGLAGYLGCELPEPRRTADHVRATVLIWRKVAAELEKIGIQDLEALRAWLQEKPKKLEKKPISFHMSREKRLQLPKGPGIYRMLSKTGEVLYVGKATSLHSRVNSYFRGGVTGDPRKLEMLARVYDIEVLECASPLEAALLENEEIKQRSPRYNRALRPSTRTLSFFSRDYREVSAVQDSEYRLGPYREGSAIHELFDFLRGLELGTLVEVFFELITEEALREGFAIFLAREGLPSGEVPALRKLLAIGMREYRAWLKLKKLAAEQAETEEATKTETENGTDTEAETQTETDEIITPEEVAEKFRGLVARAASEIRRSKRLSRLLNAEIAFEAKPEVWHTLQVANGKIQAEKVPSPAPEHPWAGLKTDDYDRMSVLLTELHRFPHRVAPLGASEKPVDI